MNRKCITLLLALQGFCMAPSVFAQTNDAQSTPTPSAAPPEAAKEVYVIPTPDYSGDIWNRSTLSGDWGGARNQLAKKGLTLDMYATQAFQGVLAGGRDKGWQYGGRENITLNLDTTKMGLWPGGFLMIEGEGNYGEFVGTRQTGALIPADANLAFPNTQGPQFCLDAFQYTQFLSPNIGFILGKLDTTSGDANMFAHGKGDRQFFDMAFGINPIFAMTVPPSALGAGVIALPTGNPEEFIVSGYVLDTEGAADSSGCNTAFRGGTTFAAEARYTTHVFNLTGHQLLGGTYSDRLYTNLDQNLRNFIIPRLPIQTSSGSWAAYYNFDQYLYQPDPKADIGLGVFGRFGISDGKANPIHYFGSVGIGGKGLIPGRKHDQFGVGYYRVCRSDSPALDDLGFRDSQGFETYYQIAITPAILLTPDFQIIEPSQQRIDTAYVLGLRLTIAF